MKILLRASHVARAVTIAMAVAPLAACTSPFRHGPLASPELPATWAAAPEADDGSSNSPARGAPDAARHDAADAASTEPAQWWRAFGDPTLDALVAQALEKNADLAMAALRVRRAQLEAGLVDAKTSPQASLTAGVDAIRAFGA